MIERKLRAELTLQGISGKRLAGILKISPTTLYRKMKKPDTWTLEEIKKISEVLSLTPDKLSEIFF